MKKIISLALCAVMLLSMAIFPANTATTGNVVSTEPYFELVGDEVYVPANKIMKSTYNITETNYPYYFQLGEVDNENNTVEIKFTDCLTSSKLVSLANKEYIMWECYKSGKSSSLDTVSYNDGAYYQKVRLRMCDFSQESFSYQYYAGELIRETHAYFLENGNYYYTDTQNGEYTFDFSIASNEKDSCLIIISGAAMTAVKPDKDGMVEFYIKKGLDNGQPKSSGVAYQTGFCTYHFGGKLKLGMGNVVIDTELNVKDATLVQKYCVGIESINSVQKYFADVNGDGRVNIMDSTEIQKYCAGI